MKTSSKQTIEISSNTIFRGLAVVALLFFAFLIKDVLAMLFFALIIASAVSVPVGWLRKLRVPRTIGVIIVYILTVVFIVGTLALVITPLANELKQFSEFIPRISSGASSIFSSLAESENQLQEFFLDMSDRLGQIKINFFSFTGNVVGRIASFFFVFVLSFYLTIEEEGVRKFLCAVTPKNKENYAVKIWERAQHRLSRWFGSQLMLGLIVGCMTFIGLSIIGVPYAIGLSLLAATFELVPTVGPILAAIPAIFIAFIQSPLSGLITLILYIVVQQLENNLLVPKIMQKTVGLNPVVTLLALLVGAKLAGLTGMIMAIPIAMLFNEFSGDIFGLNAFHKIKSK